MVAAPKDGYLRQIFVLTDGDVSNSEQVASLVRNQGRIFALGLGQGASRHLVKGISRATKAASGALQVLPPEEMQMPLWGRGWWRRTRAFEKRPTYVSPHRRQRLLRELIRRARQTVAARHGQVGGHVGRTLAEKVRIQ